ncbi:MAG: flagellar motor switch protein FliN [Spirochaetia bacterium]
MMSGGALSQDEINALLSVGGSPAGSAEAVSFSDQQLANIKKHCTGIPGFLQSSASSMMSDTVSVVLEEVFTSNKESALALFSQKILDLSLSFNSGISGGHFFLADEMDILPLGAGIAGESIDAVEGVILMALSEFFQQVGQSFANALSTSLGREVELGTPDAQIVEKGLSRMPSGNFIVVKYVVTYDGKDFPLYEILDSLVVKSFEAVSVNPAAGLNNASDMVIGASSKDSNASIGGSTMSSSVYSTTPSVKGVKLPNLTPMESSAEAQNISLLMDVSMELTVELGRTRWQVKDILGMGEGTIIELDKLAGEPVDILVNHNLIARGEVVVIDENFGVRVTEIVSNVDKITDRRG